jgi:hypothetical protein
MLCIEARFKIGKLPSPAPGQHRMIVRLGVQRHKSFVELSHGAFTHGSGLGGRIFAAEVDEASGNPTLWYTLELSMVSY